MLTLANLSPQKGSTKNKKRVGRGPGSGHGKTAGRGHKGARARSGFGSKPGFEGGQMPLQRRLPKRGFTNSSAIEYEIISLNLLDKLVDYKEITTATLQELGLVRKGLAVKVLANGDIQRAITLNVEKISGGARRKIENAGGKFIE